MTLVWDGQRVSPHVEIAAPQTPCRVQALVRLEMAAEPEWVDVPPEMREEIVEDVSRVMRGTLDKELATALQDCQREQWAYQVISEVTDES